MKEIRKKKKKAWHFALIYTKTHLYISMKGFKWKWNELTQPVKEK